MNANLERRLQGLEQVQRNLGLRVFTDAGEGQWYEGAGRDLGGQRYTDQALGELAAQGYTILKVVYSSAGAT